MAYLNLYKKKLEHNYKFLNNLFEKEGIEWGVVTKLFCGTEKYLQEIINLDVVEVHDSRISNLKKTQKKIFRTFLLGCFCDGWGVIWRRGIGD